MKHLGIIAAIATFLGLSALGQVGSQSRFMFADTNGVVVAPTNVTGIRIGGLYFTNLAGFGLAISNGQLSVNTAQLPSGTGGTGVVTSVSGDFEIVGGQLGVTNTLGTGPLLRQSAASGTGIVAVASGGTGATNAATARANLGVLSSRWLTGFGSPTDYSQGVGSYYVNLETYQVWEQTGVSTWETIPFFVMGEGVYSYLDQSNIFSRTNTFLGPVIAMGGISGNGSGLTNLNGTEIRSGTVAEARIDSAIARLASPPITGTPLVNGTNLMSRIEDHLTEAEASTLYHRTNAALATLATLNGSALTNLNGTEIRSGTVAAARIDSAIARLDSPTFLNNPTVPTQSLSVSNTTAASTAFAQQIAELRQLASTILTQLAALTNGSAGQILTWTGANTLALSNAPSGGSAADVQVFTSGTNTWTKPSGKTAVYVLCMGGGGGGGSGRRGAAGTVRGGGGSGASGAASEYKFLASSLGSNEVVVVGAGGGGGFAVTANNTSGVDGTNGKSSSFGSKLFAGGGWAGGGGTPTGGLGGNPSGGSSEGRYVGTGGAYSSGTGAAGDTGNNTINSITGSAGGAGGGITSGDAESSGGAGGAGPRLLLGSGGIAGGSAGTPGNPGGSGGSAGASLYLGGSGGGGGGSKRTANAGSGGSGGLYGAGGGGGGASENGFNSGAGGAGANGVVVVISY